LNRLSRAHERYRRQTDIQTTDGRAIAYSEREREFTFAKTEMLRRNVEVIKSTKSFVRPKRRLWWEKFVKEVDLEPRIFSLDTHTHILD